MSLDKEVNVFTYALLVIQLILIFPLCATFLTNLNLLCLISYPNNIFFKTANYEASNLVIFFSSLPSQVHILSALCCEALFLHLTERPKCT
jgi:hypothetical protein